MKIEDITLKFQRYYDDNYLPTCEEDQFEFAAQYLYDSGMKVKDIAMALGSCELTIRHVLKYLSQEEYQSLYEENENE